MCFVISDPDDFDDWPKLRITVQIIQLFRLVQSPILPSKTDVKIGTWLQACNLQTKEQQTNQRVHRDTTGYMQNKWPVYQCQVEKGDGEK